MQLMAEYQRRMKISICTSEWPPRCWSIFATTGKVRKRSSLKAPLVSLRSATPEKSPLRGGSPRAVPRTPAEVSLTLATLAAGRGREQSRARVARLRDVGVAGEDVRGAIRPLAGLLVEEGRSAGVHGIGRVAELVESLGGELLVEAALRRRRRLLRRRGATDQRRRQDCSPGHASLSCAASDGSTDAATALGKGAAQAGAFRAARVGRRAGWLFRRARRCDGEPGARAGAARFGS